MLRTFMIPLMAGAAVIASPVTAAPTSSAPVAHYSIPATPIHYRTAKVDGLDIFYREAGDPKKPTILLLHGFPSSSHMFRNLIPLLADKYHIVAPDYPGFGRSSQPRIFSVSSAVAAGVGPRAGTTVSAEARSAST